VVRFSTRIPQKQIVAAIDHRQQIVEVMSYSAASLPMGFQFVSLGVVPPAETVG
jgi:hypothetical protein